MRQVTCIGFASPCAPAVVKSTEIFTCAPRQIGAQRAARQVRAEHCLTAPNHRHRTRDAPHAAFLVIRRGDVIKRIALDDRLLIAITGINRTVDAHHDYILRSALEQMSGVDFKRAIRSAMVPRLLAVHPHACVVIHRSKPQPQAAPLRNPQAA